MRTSFVTSADGTRLRLAHWGDGARDVLIAPGLAEHAGRYEHVGAAFAAAGWSATLIEVRGHGHSGGKRGHVEHWSDYREDLVAAVAGLRPGWSLLAHSMGGLVALDAIANAGLKPSRLALSNPLLGVAVALPGWKIAAAKVLSRLIPSLPMKNEIDPTALSRDLSVGQAYLADPLVFQTGTPRFYTEMVAALARVHEIPSWSVPMSMYISPQDRVTDPKANQAFAARFHTKLTLYPEHRHELFNETDKAAIIDEVVTWLGEEAACASA
ncbi:MAG: lysophospholipase [Pseudomonadota bacterium]|nr:lysophospholipase [Pseudomonadota bacterium]